MLDRRQFQRFIPDSPPPVTVGESWTEPLFDLAEGGISVRGLPSAECHNTVSVAFRLPGANHYIQARAEIIWSNELVHRTGLRFVELTEMNRQLLRKWISSRVHTPSLAIDEEAGEPIGETADETSELAPEAAGVASAGLHSPAGLDWGSEELGSLRRSLVRVHGLRRFARNVERAASEGMRGVAKVSPPIALTLTLAIVGPLSFFLGHRLANQGLLPRAVEVVHQGAAANSTAEIKPAALVSAAANSPAITPAATPTYPDSLPFDVSGFVLQVGAMSRESNADVLRETLEQRNFPAFVVKRRTGRFYRVVVGPYGDAGAASKIKDQLAVKGFEALIKPWSPE